MVFDGLMDELLIHPRALSAAKIEADFAARTPVTKPGQLQLP